MRCPKRKRICSAERRNRGPHQHDYNRLEVARALGWSCASGQCHLDVSRYPVPGTSSVERFCQRRSLCSNLRCTIGNGPVAPRFLEFSSLCSRV